MIDKSNKAEIIFNLVWKLLERVANQGIQLVVQIILARILVPEDFGIIAIISIFIIISNVFVQAGFNTSLIQKRDVNEVDFSSVFYLSLGIAGGLYIILFFTAPYIASFYGAVQLTLVIRVLSITLFFGAVNSIQNAIIAREMQFRKLFFSSLGAVVISGIIGILMAYSGFGVWAIVAQQLINQIVVTLILWFTVNWRPKLIFSIERVKNLFSYGWKLMVSSLIDTLYMNLRSLIIGKLYRPDMLGFYNRGEQLPAIIVSNINGSIQSVMLPALSSYQDDRQKVKEMMRRSIMTSSFLLFPIMGGLAVTAEPIVRLLLTEKWLSCVPYMQVFCLSYALWPIHTANLQAINALGRSDIFLKLEITKKVIGLFILVVTIFNGVYAIAVGMLVSGLISSIINAYPNVKLLNYSIKEQWKDIKPAFLLSLLMSAAIYSLSWINLPYTVMLIAQTFVGIVLYFGLAKLLNFNCYNYIISTSKEIFKNKVD